MNNKQSKSVKSSQVVSKKDELDNAMCCNCMFGKIRNTEVIVGKVPTKQTLAECHISRPLKTGFPVVQLDDFCSYHVNRETAKQTFAGLVPQYHLNF